MLSKNNNLLKSPSKEEFISRIHALYEKLNGKNMDWDAAFILDKVNQYYFTGTMQDGVFVLTRDGSYSYFARRSIERARLECMIENVFPMTGYGDVKKYIGGNIHKIFIETEVVTYGILERIKKYFEVFEILSIDRLVSGIRAVKSQYEIACMEESGRQHDYLFETIVPGLLKEGMNEAELTAQLYAEMIKLGYHGVSRFSMFQSEVVAGQFGFGENSLYPTSFNGPGGMKGMSPAVPIVGDRDRFLKKGDLVFADIGYGVNGYHTDRTQIYMFGANPPEELVSIHRQCRQIQRAVVELLKPGNIPGQIYNTVMDGIKPEFLQNFMGYENRTAKFLGHGVGLYISEYPVIASGFDEPLVENMAIAVEPKKGVAGFGVVGVEDTYIVTPNGGKCITHGEKDIIVV